MSKVRQLQQILVIGATLTLTRSLINDAVSRSEALGQEMLVVGTNDNGFEFIIAKPQHAFQHQVRRAPWPSEDELVQVSDTGYTTLRETDKSVTVHEFRVGRPTKPSVAPPEEPKPAADGVGHEDLAPVEQAVAEVRHEPRRSKRRK